MCYRWKNPYRLRYSRLEEIIHFLKKFMVYKQIFKFFVASCLEFVIFFTSV